MDFALKAVLVALLALLAVAYCADSDDSIKTVEKRDSENTDHQLALEEDLSDLDKRRIFRYGRGVFRYGKRAPVFRYGKRGAVMRYGKREDDDDVDDSAFEDNTDDKRVFRFGKRDPDNAYKRLFRWGKRDGSDIDTDMDEEKRIFRYGKRDGDDDDWEQIKRKVFRFGKRDGLTWDDLTEEEKRRIFRYGRDTRAPQTPHVPFRFGEEE